MPYKAQKYYELHEESLELSKQLGFIFGQVLVHSHLAHYANSTGSFREAIRHAWKEYNLASFLPGNSDSVFIESAYRDLSIAYRGLGMYDSALYYIDHAIILGEQMGSPGAMSLPYMDKGHLLVQMGEQKAALKAYYQAYNIVRNVNSNDPLRATFCRMIGSVHNTAGDYRLAIKYFREADSIYGSLKSAQYHPQQASHIARAYQYLGELDSALKYRHLALKRFIAYGFKELNINIPNQYCYLGMIYREWGQFDSAKYYIDKSLDLRIRNKDSLGVGMCLDEMALMAKMNGRYQDALRLLLESLQWKTADGGARIDPRRRAQRIESQSETYLLLGQVFADWNKHGAALMYYDTSMMLCNKVAFLRGKTLVQYHRGLAWQQKGIPDTAMRYMQSALQFAESVENRPLIAKALTGLAKLYVLQGKVIDAQVYFETALNIYREDGFIGELPGVYFELGLALMKAGEQNGALEALQKAYDHASSMGKISIQADASLALAGLYEERGNISLSNKYLKDYILFHDSVFTLETHQQLVEMQAFHESQQQQLQILHLEQENELTSLRAERSQYVIISLGGIVIIVLLFVVLFFRQINIRNQQRTLLNQQQLFRSQMNPHFIFNSLTNIQHYIFQKDSLSAGKYLAVFAKLMRNILNNSNKELIALRHEVETISQYLDLQQLRMEDKLEYEIDVDEALDPELTEIPPMLAQPFIENAIEHGIRNKEGKGFVSVRITKNDQALIYEIEDNGVGRKKVAELQKNKKKGHESMAVSLTRSRLQSLWGRRKPGNILEIIDLEDSEGNPLGTLVRFKVPSFGFAQDDK